MRGLRQREQLLAAERQLLRAGDDEPVGGAGHLRRDLRARRGLVDREAAGAARAEERGRPQRTADRGPRVGDGERERPGADGEQQPAAADRRRVGRGRDEIAVGLRAGVGEPRAQRRDHAAGAVRAQRDGDLHDEVRGERGDEHDRAVVVRPHEVEAERRTSTGCSRRRWRAGSPCWPRAARPSSRSKPCDGAPHRRPREQPRDHRPELREHDRDHREPDVDVQALAQRVEPRRPARPAEERRERQVAGGRARSRRGPAGRRRARGSRSPRRSSRARAAPSRARRSATARAAASARSPAGTDRAAPGITAAPARRTSDRRPRAGRARAARPRARGARCRRRRPSPSRTRR